MQKQYRELRDKLAPGTLLLFRLGDFYEVFGDDAVTASKVIGLTLTKRHETPMAGLPYHAAPNYVNRLLAAGGEGGSFGSARDPPPPLTATAGAKVYPDPA